MIEFKPLLLSDKRWAAERLKTANQNSEEFSFAFNYIWRDIFHISAGRVNDYLVLKAHYKSYPSYLYPAGSGDVSPVIEALAKTAAEEGYPLAFHTVLAGQKALLEAMFPDCFTYTPLNDYFDYVYDSKSLITLAGKKLHGKRNHINKFKSLYPGWRYEEITRDNIQEAYRMSEEWCVINGCSKGGSLQDEACAVKEAFEAYFDLEFDGGLIRTDDGRIVAFSMGEPLNSDTYLIHIEKAFSDVQGAYAMINQQFAEHNCADFLYINREDDSGDPGLRKAKESYRPVFQVEKYQAVATGKRLR